MIVLFIIWSASLPTLLSAQSREAANAFWLPVTEEERQSKSPIVDKDAGLEALFSRVFVADEFRGDAAERIFRHYIRLKVFNEKGKDQIATIDIPSSGEDVISHVSARTIKPDGTIVEMKDSAVFKREVVRIRGLKRKVTSFAPPAVEPGAIVEYRYTETARHPSIMYVKLQFQREFPVRKATVFVWPLDLEQTAYKMYFIPYNCRPTPIKREQNGYFSSTLEQVPAFQEEIYMPGEPNVRPWGLAVYRDDSNREPEKYWNSVGRKAYAELQQALKVNDEMKQAALAATKDAADAGGKLEALIAYIRKEIRGLFDESVTSAERATILKGIEKGKSRTSQQVFKSRIATADEMNTLFAALASAVGLEARPAFVADRSGTIFHPGLADLYFLPNIDMAVQIDGAWKIYDVSAKLLPPGMLSWREQGMQALISDPRKPTFVSVPLSKPAESVTRRKGVFTLSEDGTLEGDVVEQHTGQRAGERRSAVVDEPGPAREEFLKNAVRASIPAAEVSAVKFENVRETSAPFTVSFHLRVPGYAQKTGRRLLFQPLVLQKGDSPLFTASERRYPIVFPYAFLEDDTILIKTPEGFELDHAEAPGDVRAERLLTYNLNLSARPGEFVASRRLSFGDAGLLALPREVYPQLKQLFDAVKEKDDHVISLRLKSPPSGSSAK